ncbi:MAG TPA: Rieske (2Fe-2S) protein, partial [Alphaproteobacteria bacterium]|nr:Rieske (2Fe-2S) protein [Alphaproteobacteria bacterium]
MTSQPFLRNLWYYALPSKALKRGGMQGKLLLGEPVLFCRNDAGEVFALRDICPHRGMPLSYGSFDGKEVECCYHGWKFDRAGTCTAIPSLTGHEGVTSENIKVRSYPVREAQGGIWIFMEDPKAKATELPPLPIVSDIAEDMQPSVCEVMHFPCYIDHAVIGLM